MSLFATLQYTGNVKRIILTITTITLWIGFSEFLRNQLLFIGYWRSHYTSIGLIFPEKPVNGMVWMLWSLIFAVCIAYMRKNMQRRDTLVIAWTMAFLLMWLTVGNLGTLPTLLLWFAVPLSMLEVYIAVRIAEKLHKSK